MYRLPNGEEIFIIDGHIALWDGSKENQLNVQGEQFIHCFYDYHKKNDPEGVFVAEGQIPEIRCRHADR